MAQPRLGSGPTHDMQDGVTETRIELDGEERFQLLRRELGVSAFGINLLRFQPGQRSRIHRHERQEEVYVVLEGTLTLAVEGTERELPRGAAVRVAPAVRRRLTNMGPGPLVVLALGGAAQHEGRDGLAWEDWEGARRRIPMPPDIEL